MREITLDTETTGLSPDAGHRIVEIGCVEMHGRVRTGKVFHAYLNPERDVPEEASRIHGLTTKFLADKPIFAAKVDEFLEFIGDTPLVIHNAAFDLKFINAELALCGFSPITDRCAVVDTLDLARKKFPGAQNNLDALCKRFNVDASARTHHGALLDAELLAEVYLELMGGRQSTLELLAAAASPQAAAQVERQEATAIPPREFLPSPEEVERHATMLRKLKNPIWAET